MKNLLIEWKHYDRKGNTCTRCSKTGASLQKAINDLKKELGTEKINLLFKETKLSEKEIQISNSILINGIPLEDLLHDTKVVETSCNSCCTLTGLSVSCRALSCQGQITEDIPVDLIKKAAKSFMLKKEV